MIIKQSKTGFYCLICAFRERCRPLSELRIRIYFGINMIFISNAGELTLCRPRMMHDILAKVWCREFWLYALWGRKDQHGVQVGPEANLTFHPSSSKHSQCC
jgi:hypothetical protein